MNFIIKSLKFTKMYQIILDAIINWTACQKYYWKSYMFYGKVSSKVFLQFTAKLEMFIALPYTKIGSLTVCREINYGFVGIYKKLYVVWNYAQKYTREFRFQTFKIVALWYQDIKHFFGFLMSCLLRALGFFSLHSSTNSIWKPFHVFMVRIYFRSGVKPDPVSTVLCKHRLINFLALYVILLHLTLKICHTFPLAGSHSSWRLTVIHRKQMGAGFLMFDSSPGLWSETLLLTNVLLQTASIQHLQACRIAKSRVQYHYFLMWNLALS